MNKKVQRKISLCVKKKKIFKKRNVNNENPNMVVKTKSFLVKRKSFRIPSKWSNYILKDAKKMRSRKFGYLPRIHGIWRQRKYKDLRFLSSTIKCMFRIPRPKYRKQMFKYQKSQRQKSHPSNTDTWRNWILRENIEGELRVDVAR